MILSELITLSEKEDVVVVLKSGDRAVIYKDNEEKHYLLMEKGKPVRLSLYNDDLTIIDTCFSNHDIHAVYGRAKGFNPFMLDKKVVYYKGQDFLTFDQARILADVKGLFKHEDMPEYVNIYSVLTWLSENRDILSINKMLSEKKWTTKEIE